MKLDLNSIIKAQIPFMDIRKKSTGEIYKRELVKKFEEENIKYFLQTDEGVDEYNLHLKKVKPKNLFQIEMAGYIIPLAIAAIALICKVTTLDFVIPALVIILLPLTIIYILMKKGYDHLAGKYLKNVDYSIMFLESDSMYRVKLQCAEKDSFNIYIIKIDLENSIVKYNEAHRRLEVEGRYYYSEMNADGNFVFQKTQEEAKLKLPWVYSGVKEFIKRLNKKNKVEIINKQDTNKDIEKEKYLNVPSGIGSLILYALIIIILTAIFMININISKAKYFELPLGIGVKYMHLATLFSLIVLYINQAVFKSKNITALFNEITLNILLTFSSTLLIIEHFCFNKVNYDKLIDMLNNEASLLVFYNNMLACLTVSALCFAACYIVTRTAIYTKIYRSHIIQDTAAIFVILPIALTAICSAIITSINSLNFVAFYFAFLAASGFRSGYLTRKSVMIEREVKDKRGKINK
ncbi:MAG: hypothetical protein RR594_02060 [Clostridia bacterium]